MNNPWTTKPNVRLLIYRLLGIPVVFGLFFYFLSATSILSIPISLSKLQLIILIFFEVLGLFRIYDLFNKSKKDGNPHLPWKTVFFFCLFNMFILLFLTLFYGHPGRSGYRGSTIILKIIPIVWVFVTGGFLFSTFKAFGKQISQLWVTFSIIESDKNTSKTRLQTFLFIAICLAFGLAIRLINLANFPPYVDEYMHTHDAFQLIMGGPLEWSRAYLTVSMPVFLSFKLFGISLWAGRFPMVLINMISIIPLYYLGKKINKTIGFLCIFLFSVSPWIIATSRNIREYAIIPVFFYATAVLLLDLLEWEGLNFKKYIKKNLWRIILLVLIVGYTLFDHLSILKINLVNFALFGFLLILKVFSTERSRLLRIIGIGAGVIAISFVFISRNILGNLFSKTTVAEQSIGLFWNTLVQDNFRQWYSIFPYLGYIIILIALIILIRSIFRKRERTDYAIIHCLSVFFAVLIYLSFFLVSRRVTPRFRYGALLEYWYIFAVALFLYLLYRIIIHLVKNKFLNKSIFIFILVLFIINYNSIFSLLSYKGGGSLNITDEKHFIYEPAYIFLITHVKDSDVLLTDNLVYYDELEQRKLQKVTIIRWYGIENKKELKVVDFFQGYPEGWVALSPNSQAARRGFVNENAVMDGVQIDYLGLYGEVQIWHWFQVQK